MDIQKYDPGMGRPLRNLAGIILPAFQRDSIDAHVAQILYDRPDVAQSVRADPSSRDVLDGVAYHTYAEQRKYLVAAKVIDSLDRIFAVLGEMAELVPAVGNALRWGENTLELLPKGLYALWYAHGANDRGALPYFATMEALSFVPYAGEAVDFMNLYINRARANFRWTVAQRFLRRIGRPAGSGPGATGSALDISRNLYK